MNCIQPSAPAEETLRLVPKAVSILLIAGEHLPGDPVLGAAGLVDRQQEGRDLEGVDHGLGTPIGAGPKGAMVRPGFEASGEPSGFRRMGSVIVCADPPPRPWRSAAPALLFWRRGPCRHPCRRSCRSCLPPFAPAEDPPEVDPPPAVAPPPLELPPLEAPPLEPPPPALPVEPPPPRFGGLGTWTLVSGSGCGSGAGSFGTVTVRSPTPTLSELAVPAPSTASALPRAIVSRNRLAILGAHPWSPLRTPVSHMPPSGGLNLILANRFASCAGSPTLRRDAIWAST